MPCHCEEDVLSDEAISYLIGDCFVAKSKSAPRNDIFYLPSQRQEDILQSGFASFDFFHADTFPA